MSALRGGRRVAGVAVLASLAAAPLAAQSVGSIIACTTASTLRGAVPTAGSLIGAPAIDRRAIALTALHLTLTCGTSGALKARLAPVQALVARQAAENAAAQSAQDTVLRRALGDLAGTSKTRLGVGVLSFSRTVLGPPVREWLGVSSSDSTDAIGRFVALTAGTRPAAGTTVDPRMVAATRAAVEDDGARDAYTFAVDASAGGTRLAALADSLEAEVTTRGASSGRAAQLSALAAIELARSANRTRARTASGLRGDALRAAQSQGPRADSTMAQAFAPAVFR